MLPNERGGLRSCAYNLAIPNIATAKEIQIWASDVSGIQDAQVELHEDIFTCSEAYDAEMDKRLRQMQGGFSRERDG